MTLAINPEIMVWARETAGLTRQEAARKLGFRDSARSSAEDKLTAIEQGEKEPSRPQLVKMAGQYHRPLLVFYLSKPPAEGGRGVDFRALPEGYSRSDDALLDALVREVRARQDMVRTLLEDEDEAIPLPFVGARRISDGREAVLEALRELLDVEIEPIQGSGNRDSRLQSLAQERGGIGHICAAQGRSG